MIQVLQELHLLLDLLIFQLSSIHVVSIELYLLDSDQSTCVGQSTPDLREEVEGWEEKKKQNTLHALKALDQQRKDARC